MTLPIPMSPVDVGERRKRVKLKMSENAIQKAVFKHLRERPQPGVFAFHPKNGGIHQAGSSRGIHAGLGVVSGVPDVIAIKDGRVFALELKAEFGRASPEQINVLRQMTAAGAIVSLATGLDAAIRKLEEWDLVKGTAA